MVRSMTIVSDGEEGERSAILAPIRCEMAHFPDMLQLQNDESSEKEKGEKTGIGWQHEAEKSKTDEKEGSSEADWPMRQRSSTDLSFGVDEESWKCPHCLIDWLVRPRGAGRYASLTDGLRGVRGRFGKGKQRGRVGYRWTMENMAMPPQDRECGKGRSTSGMRSERRIGSDTRRREEEKEAGDEEEAPRPELGPPHRRVEPSTGSTV